MYCVVLNCIVLCCTELHCIVFIDSRAILKVNLAKLLLQGVHMGGEGVDLGSVLALQVVPAACHLGNLCCQPLYALVFLPHQLLVLCQLQVVVGLLLVILFSILLMMLLL